ncbi:MAG: hypothetical protein CVU09_04210 [Bacteroidetes bacterium HGW-Bacteroidetes-4]|jgi:hypothetical protein|nr:MAG: hypothetical protein CVU09_04210 [Bacteroidetes bacterium HGW-Bacteroidetes-4]
MKTKLFLTLTAVAMTLVSLNAQTTKIVNQPTCKADVQLNANNQVIVRYLDTNNQKIKVIVYGENGQRLHGKTFKTDGMLKVTYDAKNLPAGQLTFNVVCNNQLACSELVKVTDKGTLTIPQAIFTAQEPVSENTIVMVNDKQ